MQSWGVRFTWFDFKDMNFMEAIKFVLSKLNFKSSKETQRKAVEGYLSNRYVFVYS